MARQIYFDFSKNFFIENEFILILKRSPYILGS